MGRKGGGLACFPKCWSFTHTEKGRGFCLPTVPARGRDRASRLSPAYLSICISASFRLPGSLRKALRFVLKHWLYQQKFTLQETLQDERPQVFYEYIAKKNKQTKQKNRGKPCSKETSKKPPKNTNCSQKTLFGFWIKQT